MRLPAICLVCAAAALAQPAPTDFIPPHSKVVFGINLRRIIDSQELRDLTTDSQSLAPLMLAQSGLLGLDPLKDVDSIVIASTGEGDTPPTLAIFRGRFGKLKLVDMKNPKSIVVLVDESTLLAGDASEVHAVIDRRDGAPGLDPALLARVASLAARFDVWGMGDKPGGFAAAKGQAGGLDAVDHFEFGASFQKGLSLDAEIHVRSTQDAQKMSESLKFFEAMLNGQKTADNGTKFSLHTQNGTLKLSMAIPEEELKKAIAAQKASMAAGAAAAAAAAKPKPTAPKDVQIITNSNGDTLRVILPGGH